MMYGGVAAPNPNWAICDGTTYVTGLTTHAALYAVIGTAYGGTGATSFKLPNLSGRSPLGVGNSGATGATDWARGSQPTTGAGGEQTHKLTGAESGVPAHNHGGTSGQNFSHSHTVASSAVVYLAAGGIGYGVASGAVNTSSASNDHSHTVGNNTAADAANSHNVMHPISVVNFIIKIL